ncbi:ATP-dependent DNA helicase RecG [Luteococcus sanguinis]|uniref:ATP-dependent DNA helicase RecG n=1 Tax=Luteococcus sanguinis TaxID=174038 RepID=A0ABW1WXQ3_9ACTN
MAAWSPQWRTETFAELNRDLSQVLGGKTAKQFAKMRITTTGDLLRHVPRRYVSGTETSTIADLVPGEDAALLLRVHGRPEPGGQEPRRRLTVNLSDGRRTLPMTLFGKGHMIKYWTNLLPEGRLVLAAGKVGEFNHKPQLAHPNFVALDEDLRILGRAKDEKDQRSREHMLAVARRGGLIGIYPGGGGLPTWEIADCVQIVREHLGDLSESLPAWVVQQEGLPSLPEAFRAVHAPDNRDEAELGAERLLFDEALSMQLTMAHRRLDNSHHRAPALTGRPGGLLDQLDARLPFQLTQGQREVSEQVFADIASEAPMQRLLQGEVGSGKTVVALRAMLKAVDSGRQAVLLAPTEVLATQHLDSIRRMLGDLGQGRTLGAPEDATEVVLVTGSMPAAARRNGLTKVASGEAGIVIGTHAVLGAQVDFADLGLVVVDEQHRFGVEQRAALNEKAELRPHVLVMTATPIPRSVAMTVFGDLETSVLTEIPAGRAEVQTQVVDAVQRPAWLERAWQRIREEVEQGRQAFVVCPRITGSDTDDFREDGAPASATVVDTHGWLTSGPLSGLRVEMLHGKMHPDDKDAAMARFAAGETDVLVATTVIEVGVDVPNASVMVVLDADRFGISQLHQLRGRIGRGSLPGLCLLVTSSEVGTPARDRLDAIQRTRDGFELAELDLAQRKEGNVLGASQSGTRTTLRLLRVIDHAELIQHCRELAERLIAADPDLVDPYLADMITQTELLAAGEWLEKS